MLSGLLIPPLLLVQSIWFLAPGLLGALALLRRDRIPAHLAVLVAALISSAVGYPAFWLYFAQRTAGSAYTALTAVLAVVAAVALLRRDNRALLRRPDVGLPLLLMLLVALFYLGVTGGCTLGSPVVAIHQSCHLS